ncbi:MAG TPA: PAS domain-containing protein, partial [bacterium]|nr:PAS domain-containing protein [bacterium]
LGTDSALSDGAVVVYRSGGQVLARWSSDPRILAAWQPLPPADLRSHPPLVVRNQTGKQLVLRAGENLPAAGLHVEVLQLVPPPVAQAAAALAEQRSSSLFLGRDLLLLVLSILVVMTLFIIFAATWMAFYLAKGFVTPIEVLADATQRVSRGDLGYKVATSSLGPLEPDFHTLVESFNMMSHQLNEQRQQLVSTSEDLRRSGQTLEERNRLVELLLEKIDAGIVSVNPQGRISAMNHAALLLLPPLGDPWLGQPYDRVLAPESAALLGHMLDRVRLNADKPASQLFSLSIRGRSVHVEASALALQTASGQSEGMVLMLKDVTVLQRNQRALAWREVARR